jgi:hypothetical protein
MHKPVVATAIVVAVLVATVLGVGALVGLVRVTPTTGLEGQAVGVNPALAK